MMYSYLLIWAAFQGVHWWMVQNHEWAKQENPNLNRKHDQDVSNNSDHTQRSSHQDDEHHLHSRVWTEGGVVFAAAGVGRVQWILHAVSSWISFSPMPQGHICLPVSDKGLKKRSLFPLLVFVCTITQLKTSLASLYIYSWQVLECFWVCSLAQVWRMDRWANKGCCSSCVHIPGITHCNWPGC